MPWTDVLRSPGVGLNAGSLLSVGVESSFTKFNKQLRMAGLLSNTGIESVWPKPQTGMAATVSKVMESLAPRPALAFDSRRFAVSKVMENGPPRYGVGIESVWPKPQTGMAATVSKVMESLAPRPALAFDSRPFLYSSVLSKATECMLPRPALAFDPTRVLARSAVGIGAAMPSFDAQIKAAASSVLGRLSHDLATPIFSDVVVPEVGDLAADVGGASPAEWEWTWPDALSLDYLKLMHNVVAWSFCMTVVTLVMLGYRYDPEHLMLAGAVERTIALALYTWERLQEASAA